MNYYANDYLNCSKQSERQLIQIADDILSLYSSGEKSKSLARTKDFLVAFELYLTGIHEGGKKDGKTLWICNIDEISRALKGKYPDNIDVIKLEIQLAANRVRYGLSGKPINQCGYEHNVRFVDWGLRLLNLIKITAFQKANDEYLKSVHRNFPHEKENQYSGRKKAFYRNAYRAEMYSHCLYTSPDQKGQYDMYTPLILSRMAVEQFLKYRYEEVFQKEAPDKPAVCKKQLDECKDALSKAFSNELSAVLKRGNLNTHEGYANFVFANIHCNAVLKECFDQM